MIERIQRRYVPHALMIFLFSGCGTQNHVPELRGPYFGQQPPGMIPEVFLPGILNTEDVAGFCSEFSPDLSEFYFVRYVRGVEGSTRIYWTQKVVNDWTTPERAPFSGDYPENDMRISPDGNTMLWRSWRPLPGHEEQEDSSLVWYSTRIEGGWSAPRPLRHADGFLSAGYLSITGNGTLYFALRREDGYGEGDIYISRYADGTYTAPANLGASINTAYSEGDLYVDPDERFLIVSCWNHPENNGVSDLYVSFRDSAGEWSALRNIGPPVNSEHEENCPTLTPDGEYFFFNRRNPDTDRGNIYWVDARIIDRLKPD